jgi:hypothetical protein
MAASNSPLKKWVGGRKEVERCVMRDTELKLED